MAGRTTRCITTLALALAATPAAAIRVELERIPAHGYVQAGDTIELVIRLHNDGDQDWFRTRAAIGIRGLGHSGGAQSLDDCPGFGAGVLDPPPPFGLVSHFAFGNHDLPIGDTLQCRLRYPVLTLTAHPQWGAPPQLIEVRLDVRARDTPDATLPTFNRVIEFDFIRGALPPPVPAPIGRHALALLVLAMLALALASTQRGARRTR